MKSLRILYKSFPGESGNPGSPGPPGIGVLNPEDPNYAALGNKLIQILFIQVQCYEYNFTKCFLHRSNARSNDKRRQR